MWIFAVIFQIGMDDEELVNQTQGGVVWKNSNAPISDDLIKKIERQIDQVLPKCLF
jgi:hypothetical protein